FFFFQAEDGIRDFHVTGVQTCALPIYAVADVDRIAVASFAEHGLAERGGTHVRILRQAFAAAAGHIFDFVDLDAEFIGRRLQAAILAEGGIGQLRHRLVEAFAGALPTQLVGKLLAHAFETLDAEAADLVELENVETEVRLHRATNLALVHGEQRILERACQHATLDGAQAAALRRTGGVVRHLAGHRGEVFARLYAPQGFLGTGTGGVIRSFDEDVAHHA